MDKYKTVIETCRTCNGSGIYTNENVMGNNFGDSYKCFSCNNSDHAKKGTGKVKVKYLWREHRNEWVRISSEPADSGCFLTTIVCDLLGYDDNCNILEKLRSFRDAELLTNDEGIELFSQYRDISESIVPQLQISSEKIKISKTIFSSYLPAVEKHIDSSEKELAICKYREMVNYAIDALSK